MNLTYEEVVELEKNFAYIDDSDYANKVRLEARRLLRDLFNNYGNFKQANFDAHRNYRYDLNEAVQPWQKDCKRIHEFLFDDVGNLREIIADALPHVIEGAGFGWRSNAVHLHYANVHGLETSGSYPATWMHK